MQQHLNAVDVCYYRHPKLITKQLTKNKYDTLETTTTITFAGS